MNTFNVEETAKRTLLLMEQNGVKPTTIRAYRFTGIGTIVRHFTGKSFTDITNEMLDTFLVEHRACFECGEISNGAWSLIRRSCEFFKTMCKKKFY